MLDDEGASTDFCRFPLDTFLLIFLLESSFAFPLPCLVFVVDVFICSVFTSYKSSSLSSSFSEDRFLNFPLIPENPFPALKIKKTYQSHIKFNLK